MLSKFGAHEDWIDCTDMNMNKLFNVKNKIKIKKSLFPTGAQIKLDLETIKSSRAFCNKIWQAARFALIAMERKPSFRPYPFPLEDHIDNENLT